MKLFSKKSAAERRDATAAKLSAAEAEAKAAQEDRLRLALAGEATDAAEETAWKLAARVKTLSDALAALDEEIVETEAAQAASERKKLRDEAAVKIRDRKQGAIELQAKLGPVLEEIHHLAICHDSCCTGFMNNALTPALAPAGSTLFVAAEAQRTFEILLQRLGQDDDDSLGLAKRVLAYVPPTLRPIE